MVATTALALQRNVTSVTSVTSLKSESTEGAATRRRRPGRPTLLAEGAGDVLLAAVRAGNRLSIAARAAGLAPSTVEEWMRRGRGLDVRPATAVFVRFVEAVEVAQAAAEAEAVAVIRGGMTKDWKAAAWYLSNVSSDWRQHRMRPPEPPPTPAPTPVPPPWQSETIMLTQEELRTIAEGRLRQERGETVEQEEQRRLALSRLVVSEP